jgi:hypothetical protein
MATFVLCHYSLQTDYTSGPMKLGALTSEAWGLDVVDDAEPRSFARPLETIRHLRTRSMTKTKLTSLRKKETQMGLVEAS